MQPERLYIIDPTNFKGYAENTMSAPAGSTPTHADYMDKPTTFEEYKKLEGNENLIAITWEELDEKYLKPHLKSLQKPFVEITKKTWHEMLNVLPPQRWTYFTEKDSFFFIIEATTFDLHACFVKYKGKYWEGLRSIHTKREDLIKEIEEQCI